MAHLVYMGLGQYSDDIEDDDSGGGYQYDQPFYSPDDYSHLEDDDEEEQEFDDSADDYSGQDDYGGDEYQMAGDDGEQPVGGGEQGNDEEDDSDEEEGGQDQGEGSAEAENDSTKNMKFDTEFLRKYYRRIRNHALIKELFDKLNVMAAPQIYGLISTPTAFFDHLICLVKPKYVMPTHKLDVIIEIVLIDDGIISSLCAGFRPILDSILGMPVVKQAGDTIIAACRKAGIFSNTLMAVNQALVRNQNSKKQKQAAEGSARAASESQRLSQQARQQYNSPQRGEMLKAAEEKRKESERLKADSERRKQEDKVMRNDYRSDRAAHGLGAGFAGLAEGALAAKQGGLRAGLKAGAKATFNESALGRTTNAIGEGARAFKDAKGSGMKGALKAGYKGYSGSLRAEPDANDMSDRKLNEMDITRDGEGNIIGVGATVGKNTFDLQQDKKDSGHFEAKYGEQKSDKETDNNDAKESEQKDTQQPTSDSVTQSNQTEQQNKSQRTNKKSQEQTDTEQSQNNQPKDTEQSHGNPEEQHDADNQQKGETQQQEGKESNEQQNDEQTTEHFGKSQTDRCTNCGKIGELDGNRLCQTCQKLGQCSNCGKLTSMLNEQGLCQDCEHDADIAQRNKDSQ